MKKKWLTISKNLLLLVSSLLICFVFLEVTFRIIVPKNPLGTTYGKPISINSDGLRDREFVIPKPDNTYRILVLGDSFTWGVGLDVEETIPKLLERRLSESSEIGNFEVINAAIPGYNTIEEFLLLREKGLKYKPDIVLLIYNLNDIEYLMHLSEKTYGDKEPTPVVEIDSGEDITKYSKNSGFRGLVLKIERHSVFVRFLVPRVGSLLRRMNLIQSTEFSWVQKIYQGFTNENPGWLESKRGLTKIAEACRVNDCDFLIAVYPLLVELDNYKGYNVHRTILEFCRTAGIKAVDLLPIFENTKAQSHWINFMDSHPNANAHKMIAETLLPVIRNQIKSHRVDTVSNSR